jgi:hypothetical protein
MNDPGAAMRGRARSIFREECSQVRHASLEDLAGVGRFDPRFFRFAGGSPVVLFEFGVSSWCLTELQD